MSQTSNLENSFSAANAGLSQNSETGNPYESPLGCEPAEQLPLAAEPVNKGRLYFAVIWMNLLAISIVIVPFWKLSVEGHWGWCLGSSLITGCAAVAAISAVPWRQWVCLFFLLLGLGYFQHMTWTDFWRIAA